MAAPPFRVKALYDYLSEEPDDLKFSNGQLITVTEEEDADWYYGEYEDSGGSKQEGLFPKNFVKIFEPETPPRPSRISRSRRDLEPSAPSNELEKVPSAEEPEAHSPDVSAPIDDTIIQDQAVEKPPKQSTPAYKMVTPSLPSSTTTTKPAPDIVPKAAPPPTAEKPASGSFRDRINAFNKSAAPPVAPMKPGGLGASGSGFVKKPFVAPPPSKNAYVSPAHEPPPPKVYRREEDPESVAQTLREAENDGMPAQSRTTPSMDDAEDQPKPASLKDRIALLQKQQMEQAARHAEAGQKKEKPKRPPKKHVEPQEVVADQEEAEGETLERINSGETTGKRSMDAARSSTRPRKSREATPVGSPVAVPSRELLSDPNDADQSGVGDTEDGEELSTGRDDSDEKPQRKSSMPSQRQPQAPIREADVGDVEDNTEEDDAEEEEEEELIDPEVKRRMEIRERMAKMSGGMGMAGMFGPPGNMPPRTTTKQSSGSSERKTSGNFAAAQADSLQSRAPPVPIMPMPGLRKVRSPEQDNDHPEVGTEEADIPKSIVQRRDPENMPDVEDVKEEPVENSRRSTEQSAPPPVPQGIDQTVFPMVQ